MSFWFTRRRGGAEKVLPTGLRWRDIEIDLPIDLRWGGGALERSGGVTEGPQTSLAPPSAVAKSNACHLPIASRWGETEMALPLSPRLRPHLTKPKLKRVLPTGNRWGE